MFRCKPTISAEQAFAARLLDRRLRSAIHGLPKWKVARLIDIRKMLHAYRHHGDGRLLAGWLNDWKRAVNGEIHLAYLTKEWSIRA